jgi:glucose/arabinose dehydrogenase
MWFSRPKLATALAAGASLQLVACRDATQPVAPDLEPNLPALHRTTAPPEPILLGAPLFGLHATRNGGLLAAVASAGVIRVSDDGAKVIAELPGINDVVSVGHGVVYAVTGGSEDPNMLLPTSMKLFRVSHGRVREVADLFAFEEAVNPDKIWHEGAGAVQSNPFDVAVLKGGRLLVADAAGNDILVVKANGDVDWVAVLTPAFTRGPEPVATSIAVGPDGAYYAGELTGFPGTPGLSRIWRIARGSRHVVCPSSECAVFASGFTSIIDLAFGPDGRLYVVELDEAGWLAVEGNGFAATPAGGTVSSCNVRRGSCSVVESGLSLPTAVTVDRDGTVWVSEHAPMLFAGARVRALCQSGDGRRRGHSAPSLPSCE